MNKNVHDYNANQTKKLESNRETSERLLRVWKKKSALVENIEVIALAVCLFIVLSYFAC